MSSSPEQKGCGPCKSAAFRGTVRTFAVATSIACVVVSVFGLLGAGIDPRSVIACVYQSIMAIILCLSELKFKVAIKWFRFTAPYRGLAAFYLFLAVFTIQEGRWWQILVAAACGTIGVVYCGFSCAGLDRGLNMAEIDGFDEKAAARAYAVSKAKDMNTAENRAIVADQASKAAKASLEADSHGYHKESAKQPLVDNPFESDNPFASSGRNSSAYA
jgi:hypothetical protein